ncbi:hypothetical protein GCM10023188_38540 [Pontibacter saemangeumensis]|uniref:Uncharacterized protein n=1 Tax=Pontibacter saemangeumensis TaxID=1084525 RepID=A0ABP8LZ06_9BACT
MTKGHKHEPNEQILPKSLDAKDTKENKRPSQGRNEPKGQSGGKKGRIAI